MELNEESMQAARDAFIRNPFWKDIWDGAPAGAQRRLNLSFWFSTYKDEPDTDWEAYRQLRGEVENALSLEDLAYLIEHDNNKAAQKHFRDLYSRVQFRALYTDEKLDEAVDYMTSGCSAYEREAYRNTRIQLRACTDSLVKYEWLWKATGGDAETCLLMGDVFDHGHGVDRNEDLSFFWFRKGALCGSGECCYRLATVYEDPESMRYNMDAAMFWFREGLRRQCTMVCYELAHRLVHGPGEWADKRNPVLGVEMLRSCLEDDEDGYANFYLAQCLEEGLGTEKDVSAAIRHYRTAAERKHRGAEKALQRLQADE